MSNGTQRRMENPPLARHPALQPLSREHFGGLVLARDLLRAAEEDATSEQRRDVLRRLRAAWREELAPHFADEERLLGPLIQSGEQFRRLIAEHREIERLVHEAAPTRRAGDPDRALLAQVGQLLHDHIRWEERTLFPEVERAMSAEAAAEIARRTAEVEAERPGARRRCDLDRGPAGGRP